MAVTRILIEIARKWNKVSSMRKRISARDVTEDSHKTRRSSPITPSSSKSSGRRMTDTRISIKIAGKRNKASSMRRRISARDDTEDIHETRRSSPIAAKGQVTVYTMDRKRFTIPLRYLDNGAIRELFDLSEEEYGLRREGPITLPCDAAFMEGLVRLIQMHERSEFEKTVLCVMSCVV